MIFWRRKVSDNLNNYLNSKEYDYLIKRNSELVVKIDEITAKLDILTTNYNNLRGNFNRKLSGIKEEEKVEPKEEEKNINATVFLSPNGAAI